MVTKDFFTGGVGMSRVWTVSEVDHLTDAKPLDEMEIKDKAGNDVSFHFKVKLGVKFGDGCWNHHVGKGTYQNGKITAEITDNPSCTPPPKGNLFEISEDTLSPKKAGKDLIWCEVWNRQEGSVQQGPDPVAEGDEEIGEFGAEDDN